jgi:hypothetical protein
MQVKFESNKVKVDGEQLIFYHFHGLKYSIVTKKYIFFQPAINYYLNSQIISLIYLQYLNILAQIHLELNKVQREVSFKSIFRNLHKNFPRKLRISK